MSEMSVALQPSVYEYLDYRVFLNDWLAAKRVTTPGYSLRRFARKAGCSCSYVRLICAGERRLLPRQLEGFIVSLRLNQEEAEFLTLLVRYPQSPSLLERAQLLHIISGTLFFRADRQMEGARRVCLRRPICDAVRFCPDLRIVEPPVARALKLPEDEARFARRDSLAVKNLVLDGQNIVRARHIAIGTAPAWIEIARVKHSEDSLYAVTVASEYPRLDQYLYADTATIPNALAGAFRVRNEPLQRRAVAPTADTSGHSVTYGAIHRPICQVSSLYPRILV